MGESLKPHQPVQFRYGVIVSDSADALLIELQQSMK